MLFSSTTFLFFFLPAVLFLYYIARKKYRNTILCLASLLFYSWGEPKFVILMLVSVVVNYFLARAIAKTKTQAKKIIFIIAIFFNLGLLGFFKYFNFSISILESASGSSFNLPIIELPIGISFYTFQILSYVIDVYKKKVKAQKNIITLATYISFFPQLIAGPIVQYSDIKKQLKKRKESLELFIFGTRRFILGLAKKVVIANNVAIIADTIYSQPILEVSSLSLWLAALAYALQIYFDFSGYSDMAIGLGKMFGFTFFENFNYPYIATSIQDFWRRWHISLSTWFRDYVYIPLGGNRVSKIMWIRNIMVVWLLTGIWHGANWNFIIWGIYYGVLLLLERTIFAKIVNKTPKALRYLFTMFLVIIGWTIFRIEDLFVLGQSLAKMFFLTPDLSPTFVIHNSYNLICAFPFLLIGIIFANPYPKLLFEKITSRHTFFIPVKYTISLALFGISIFFLISNSYNPFIYFRF